MRSLFGMHAGRNAPAGHIAYDHDDRALYPSQFELIVSIYVHHRQITQNQWRGRAEVRLSAATRGACYVTGRPISRESDGIRRITHENGRSERNPRFAALEEQLRHAGPKRRMAGGQLR